MGFIEDAIEEQKRRKQTPAEEKLEESTFGSDTVTVAGSQTEHALNDNHWLISDQYGVPRGRRAHEARQLGSSPFMEAIKDVVIDQMTGGEITWQHDELPQGVLDFRDAIEDMLKGPHYMGGDFDDILTALLVDGIDLGTGYLERIPSKNGQVPVATTKPVDAITIQHNLKKNGDWKSPAYYQAQWDAYSGSTADGATGSSAIDPNNLNKDQLFVLKYPNTTRTEHPVYGKSFVMKVRDWLEFLVNNTKHINRFYNDNEIPPGIMHVVNASEGDIDDIKAKVEEASADPRDAPIVGGEGVNWVEIGGTALDMDIISEQQWFLKMVWSAIGVNKAEMGIIEDVNRSAGIEQSKIIYKRVTKPLTQAIDRMVNTQILPSFDLYNELGQPFEFHLKHSDPMQERAMEQEALEKYEAGVLTFNEVRQKIGEDPIEAAIEAGGTEIPWADMPPALAQAALGDAEVSINE